MVESVEYHMDDLSEKVSETLIIFDSDLPPLEDVINLEDKIVPAIKKTRSKKKKSKTA